MFFNKLFISIQIGGFWEDDLQSVVQMGFGQNQEAALSSQSFQGTNFETFSYIPNKKLHFVLHPACLKFRLEIFSVMITGYLDENGQAL